MSTYIYKTLFCFILFFASISFAKMVTISGTVTDTILETGSGKEPVLKIIPIEACSLSISAGCTETVLDKYFVKTDKSGFYSITVNLPDECAYKLYLFRLDGRTSTKTTVSSGFGIPVDSITPTLKKNLNIPHQMPVDSVKKTHYAHYFNFSANNIIHGGDSIIVSHKIYGLSDNPDTLHFQKCKHRILLLTTSKDTVYNADFNCGDLGSWVNLKKGWYSAFIYTVTLPKDLQKTNASFALDRKLILELKLYDNDVTYTTPPFVVVDSDIRTVNLITASSPKQLLVSTSKSVLSVKSNQLHMIISQSGIYSVELFTLDGRSSGSIVKDQYLSTGEHLFTMRKDAKSSQKLHIIKLKGNGISESILINNF